MLVKLWSIGGGDRVELVSRTKDIVSSATSRNRIFVVAEEHKSAAVVRDRTIDHKTGVAKKNWTNSKQTGGKEAGVQQEVQGKKSSVDQVVWQPAHRQHPPYFGWGLILSYLFSCYSLKT